MSEKDCYSFQHIEPSQNNFIRRTKRGLTDRLMTWVNRLQPLSIESQNNVQTTRSLLTEDPSLALIFTFNHGSHNDPGVSIVSADQHFDPEYERDTYLLGSQWTLDNKQYFRNTARAGQALMDVNIIPTIQSYMAKDPAKYGYTTQDIKDSRENLVLYLNEIKARRQNLGRRIKFHFAPEGGRNTYGLMQEGDEGIQSIIKKLRPALVIPTGIWFPEDMLDFKRGYNFGKKIQVAYGEPISTSTHTIKHEEVMTGIASVLPWQLRGVWG